MDYLPAGMAGRPAGRRLEVAYAAAGAAAGVLLAGSGLFLDMQVRAWLGFEGGSAATSSSLPALALAIVAPLLLGRIFLSLGRSQRALRDRLGRLAETEALMQEQARRDPLTGLFNRAHLTEVLAEGIATGGWEARGALLYMLDLGGFRTINETFGHSAGDRVLEEIAARLAAVAHEDDIAVRLGGDEFVVVHFPTADETFPHLFAERLLAVLTREIRLDDTRIAPAVSIGVAAVGLDGKTWSDVVRAADVALYQAKIEPQSAYRVFQHDMQAARDGEAALEADMRRGIERGEFELHYQPIYGTESGVIRSFEALVRWNHPEKGQIPPMEFIPLAESSGLIIRLGRRILTEACRTAATWPKPIGIGVNLSPVQFRDASLVDHVETALAESGLAPGRLDLEITESLLLEPSPRVGAAMQRLKELGIRITMDDFGTGYSGLSNLRNFRFDRLKIDRCFTRDIAENADDAEIVRAIVRLSRTLRMETILEGVETKGQLDFARSEGLTEVQGFYYAKPMTRADVDRLLEERSGKADEAAPGNPAASAA